MLVALDPTDQERRVLAVSKTNLSPKPDAWAFEIDVDGGEPVARWRARVDATSDELVVAGEPVAVRKGSLAQALLIEMLAHEDVAAKKILAEAKRRGIGESNVRAAKKQLGVTNYDLRAQIGEKGHGPSMWTMKPESKRSVTDSGSDVDDLNATGSRKLPSRGVPSASTLRRRKKLPHH
jgi:hypothetical protein